MKSPFRKKNDTTPRRRQPRDGVDGRHRQEENLGNKLFQRNRTLVGSISPLITSANELNASLKSPRAHSHHLFEHRRRLGRLFLIFMLTVVFLIWFLYEFTANIRIVAANVSTSTIQTKRYDQAITDYLAARPQERIRAFTDVDGLAEYLNRITSEVDTVARVGSGGFATTRYELSFREPVASWLIGSDLYYVDKNGVPFQRNYFSEPKVKIVDNSGVPQVAGTVVASSSFLRFVGLSVDTARVFGIQVTQATIPEGTTRQIELRIANHSYPIKLSLDRPVGEQIEDMKKAADYLRKQGITPKYVDVRVSGRAYYK